jgi:Bacterial PH domain
VTDSAPHGEPATTVDAQARKAKKVAYISAALVFVIFTGVAFTLRGKTDSGSSVFHVEDQIAMILLGLLAGAIVLVFTRPRIIADAEGVRVRNLLAWKYFPWPVIAAVRFDRGSPWVALDLQDDDVISVMAVQAADKEYALDTVRALRRLLAASRERPVDSAASRERPVDSVASRERPVDSVASRERPLDSAASRERPLDSAAEGGGAPAI